MYLASAAFLGLGFVRFYLDPQGGYPFVAGLLGPWLPALRVGMVSLGAAAMLAALRVAGLEVTRVRGGGDLSISKLRSTGIASSP